jgi:outer membrane protein insertion porin family
MVSSGCASIVKSVPRAGARFLLIFIGLLAWTGPCAAAAPLEGLRIASIRFDPARQPLPASELSDLVALKSGDILHMSEISAAIQRLFATGRYADIAVDATETAGSVAIRFITEANYFIGNVDVEGAPDPPNKGQLVTATKLQVGSKYAGYDLRQAIENLQTRLRANGLFQAKITPHADLDPTLDLAKIDFRIDPGDRAKFAGLNVEGRPERPVQDLIRSTGWRRFLGLGWRPVTETRVQNGVERIRRYYEKHGHIMARVGISRMQYDESNNRVTPTLFIDAGPVIRVRTRGAGVSEGRLRQLLPIFQEHTVDQNLLVEGQRNLVDYFQSKGYFDATVDYESFPTGGDDEQMIEYYIRPERRHKVAEVEITGNHYFDTETLRERMYVAPATLLRYRHGRYSRRYLEKDVQAIRDLYRANGFRDVRVESKVIDNYRGDEGKLAVVLNIEEGPQWLVSKLELEGVSDADRERLMPLVHSAPGQPFSEVNVAADRDRILGFYFDNGYPNASFDWSQSTGGDEHRVNLRYVIAPGKRKYVRNVLINGLQHTNPALVTDRITFGPGDPLSQSAIAEAQRRLYDLGIFAKVQTAIRNPDGDETSKDVIYDLEEARRWSFNTGFGAELGRIGGSITSFDAPAGATGFAPRVSVGVSRLNFLGLAHTLSIQTRASTLQRRALFSYFAPQFTGSENLNLTFTTLYDDSRDVRTFAARRLEGSVQLGQKLSRANTLQYRFTYRDVLVDPNSVKITPQLIPILSQSVRVGQISATFIQDRRDDPTDAHKGIYNTIDVAWAARAFGSQTSFDRLLVRNSTYHRITRDLTFARSTSFGLIERLGGLPDIPLPERIFSGGSSSHRGFPDNQAGPRDPITGFPLGGKALLMNSLELRFPLIGDNLSGVLFHDAGNVYSSVRDISFRYHQRDLQDFDYMVHAFGLGIRYRTPVGPVRVDLAVAPNSPRFFGFKGDRETLLRCAAPGSATPCESVPRRIPVFEFHFSLGQAF